MQKHEAHGSSETQITTGGTHQLKALVDLIGNDAFAMSFQSVRQYREALLNAAPAVQGEPVEYQCHSCRKTTPPPAPFKAYVECDECGALTAAPIAARLIAPQPAEQQPDVAQLVAALEQCITSMLDSGYRVNAVVIQAARAALAAHRKQGGDHV